MAAASAQRFGARKDPEEKLAYYEVAISLKPDYAMAFNNRGAARDGKGDFDGALADYNEALRLKPGFGPALDNRCVLPLIR